MDNASVNAAITQAATDAAKQAATQVAQHAAKGFWERIFGFYSSFIHMFPEKFQWVVSLVIILAVASFLWNLIKKNWLWLILLVALFPGILPILKNLFDSLTILVVGKPLP